MMDKYGNFQTIPFPRMRRLMVDGGRIGRERHTVHGLFEVDVTLARQAIREHRARTGERLSFTAFVIACLGKAVDMNRHMHAYRNWRNQLVIFDEVDLNTLFEVEADGGKTIRPAILRAVNKKSFRDIHEEIRAFQAGHETSRESGFIRRFVLLPAFVRRRFYWLLSRNPQLVKEYTGTVLMTAVGMFATGAFWGIPVPNHTLQITLGGIAEKPGVADGQISIREYLSVTMSFDHDIVDGAPAARFAEHLRELIESAHGICDTSLSG
jgi:pyruvate/2-oxoglutarate dehydrogenase complex dihydrolipoamide acyltransferase (E2) component